LSLTHDKKVTDRGLAKLRSLKNLKKLIVSETTTSGFDVLQKEFPKVEIIR
jgi:hypothetical protein